MKILYVLNSTTPHGGDTKAFFALLDSLILKGIEAVVVVPNTNGIYKTLCCRKITTYVLNYRPALYPYWNGMKDYVLALPRMIARLVVNAISSRKLVSIIKQEKPDIVHTNVGVTNIGYRAAKAAKTPHVYHIREYGDKDFHMYHFPTRRSFYKILDNSWSICITKDIQAHYRQTGNPRSRVIYDAIGPECAKYSRKSSEKPYYLYAGRIEPSKGLYSLLEAYNVDIPLLVAGAHTSNKLYLQKCQALIEERHLPVQFLGQRDDLPELQKGALAQIIPSRFEGFGLCMPEGMFQGCLAIARNTGGSKEQLDNGLELTGKMIGFRYNTQEELSNLLKHIPTMSEAEKTEMRDRAFYCVNNLYTTEVSTDKVLAFYKEILQTP